MYWTPALGFVSKLVRTDRLCNGSVRPNRRVDQLFLLEFHWVIIFKWLTYGGVPILQLQVRKNWLLEEYISVFFLIIFIVGFLFSPFSSRDKSKSQNLSLVSTGALSNSIIMWEDIRSYLLLIIHLIYPVVAS